MMIYSMQMNSNPPLTSQFARISASSESPAATARSWNYNPLPSLAVNAAVVSDCSYCILCSRTHEIDHIFVIRESIGWKASPPTWTTFYDHNYPVALPGEQHPLYHERRITILKQLLKVSNNYSLLISLQIGEQMFCSVPCILRYPLVDFVARKDFVTVMTEFVLWQPYLMASPIHYMVKIELFSLLAKSAVETFESGIFEAGVLYPNGNKSRNVKDYISLYLAMVDTSSLPPGWEVNVIFRLFLLDQITDSYLERSFHGLKLECGFDQFIQLSTFNDARHGFLLGDTCVLGAEVYVSGERSRGKGEVLSMAKEPPTGKYTWKIANFSKLDEKPTESPLFRTGDHQWKILLYPKGKDLGMGTYLSLYLVLDLETLPAGCRVYADITLSFAEMVSSSSDKRWFDAPSSESGWSKFVSLDYLQSNNYLVAKDTCIIEAEVILLGIRSPLNLMNIMSSISSTLLLMADYAPWFVNCAIP
uniref:MATH domain-containing protein n=1 Tax=Salix viminalis TaxID=40686 RepID=A0A6N2LN32_SALVM